MRRPIAASPNFNFRFQFHAHLFRHAAADDIDQLQHILARGAAVDHEEIRVAMAHFAPPTRVPSCPH